MSEAPVAPDSAVGLAWLCSQVVEKVDEALEILAGQVLPRLIKPVPQEELDLHLLNFHGCHLDAFYTMFKVNFCLKRTRALKMPINPHFQGFLDNANKKLIELDVRIHKDLLLLKNPAVDKFFAVSSFKYVDQLMPELAQRQ